MIKELEYCLITKIRRLKEVDLYEEESISILMSYQTYDIFKSKVDPFLVDRQSGNRTEKWLGCEIIPTDRITDYRIMMRV